MHRHIRSCAHARGAQGRSLPHYRWRKSTSSGDHTPTCLSAILFVNSLALLFSCLLANQMREPALVHVRRVH
eukprot:3257310-Alexandrium_andersonii.AAC.1